MYQRFLFHVIIIPTAPLRTRRRLLPIKVYVVKIVIFYLSLKLDGMALDRFKLAIWRVLWPFHLRLLWPPSGNLDRWLQCWKAVLPLAFRSLAIAGLGKWIFCLYLLTIIQVTITNTCEKYLEGQRITNLTCLFSE